MKKLITILLALILCAGAVAAAEAPAAGGWSLPAAEPQPLPEDAQAAFDRAMEGLDGANYTPVALLGTQVVAGTNYCLLCQVTPVTPNPEPVWALVYIYADLQGNAEILNVYELYIQRHAFPADGE